MRVHILSDLHLEFAPFSPSDVNADVVVLAGDTHNGRNGIDWCLSAFPRRPVIYVLGNHEFYGEKIPKLTSELKERTRGSNVHVLENDCVEIGNTVFLGATLWTDFRLNGDILLAELAAQTGMTDFRRIRVTPSYRRFRPADARLFHARSLEWLARTIREASGKKIVVVTHHAPSGRSIPPRYHGDPLNPAFASDLEAFVSESKAALWIHGHIHEPSDYVVGAKRIIANPRGYPTEGHVRFDPSLVIEI